MEIALPVNTSKKFILSTGFAIFAMFFGAGNIVFPLALGQFAQNQNIYGILGLILTAVVVPLIGLMSMLLFEGDYRSFFARIGKVPGFVLMLLVLGLIGPFAGIPRCITVSYSTLSAMGLNAIFPIPLGVFSALTCVGIVLLTLKPSRMFTVLGSVLTPLLLVALAAIVIKGFFVMPEAPISSHTALRNFGQGLLDGYNTMDLLAAFFFSSVVLVCLRRGQAVHQVSLKDNRRLLFIATIGSLIAAALLAAVYFGLSSLAAGYSLELEGTPHREILGTLAFRLLGPYAGWLAGIAVLFACLTTEIALTAIFSSFLHETLFKKKIPYSWALAITATIALVVSTLDFDGILLFLVPILQMCYPALIALAVLNILHKLCNFKMIKPLFYGVLLLSIIAQLI